MPQWCASHLEKSPQQWVRAVAFRDDRQWCQECLDKHLGITPKPVLPPPEPGVGIPPAFNAPQPSHRGTLWKSVKDKCDNLRFGETVAITMAEPAAMGKTFKQFVEGIRGILGSHKTFRFQTRTEEGNDKAVFVTKLAPENGTGPARKDEKPIQPPLHVNPSPVFKTSTRQELAKRIENLEAEKLAIDKKIEAVRTVMEMFD